MKNDNAAPTRVSIIDEIATRDDIQDARDYLRECTARIKRAMTYSALSIFIAMLLAIGWVYFDAKDAVRAATVPQPPQVVVIYLPSYYPRRISSSALK